MQVFCTCHALRGGPPRPGWPLGTWAVLRAQFAVRDPPSSPNPRCLPAPLPDRPRPVDSCPVYPDPVSLSDCDSVSTC